MSRRPVENPVWTAPVPTDAGDVDLEAYAYIARLYGGRTVATATQTVPAGRPFIEYVEAGDRLIRAFSAALALAGLELDPDAARPVARLVTSFVTHLPGDTPSPRSAILVSAHVRLVGISDVAR